ncbi:IucA/IucC family protein [Alkalihalobacillus sp. LMS39]|uniref:IucA/IucC family protein n=1 Tax=Alkalihalobacillus sp. LMS39 TaxID=2924032 RepID=UPI001FB39B35|nr:IucA/IucC family protein [Alkalihalobacillus sp. LMS39]UOE94092.1 siderophore biosynthesis protein [Alkalihalobacillus sp. LMS39]
MEESAKTVAEHASFQAFINSYLREGGNCGRWIRSKEWIKENPTAVNLTGINVIELVLIEHSKKFVLEIKYRSIVGRHLVGVPLKYCSTTNQWVREDRLIVMMTLIQELHLLAKRKGYIGFVTHYDELIVRLIESYHTMTNYIESRICDSEKLYSVNSTFIETEQSLLFGHWLHPTPKSRQGMASWQHKNYAPELAGSFQLHYFEVSREVIEEESILNQKASEIVTQSLLRTNPNLDISKESCVIPTHPLQAQWLLQQDYVKEAIDAGQIKSLGTMGPVYTATSSIRTVYSFEEDWMLKFSIPVKITNSLRVNKQHELKAGIVMASLFRKLPFLQKHSTFHIIEDPAYLTVHLPGRKESGFEIIIRSNPICEKEKHKRGFSSVAAIAQDPLPTKKSRLFQLIETIALAEGRTVKSVSLDWFKKYWNCAIEPLILLYDEHGIALEAHQQNSVLDVSNGYPESYYYRDNQGYYLSKDYEQALCFTEPTLLHTPELFYEDSLIQERFTYYLFMNQLFSVIYRFGADGLIREEKLLQYSKLQLRLLEKRLHGQGKRFVSTILHQKKLSYKANLLTRLHDVDELSTALEQAIYTKVENPFVPVKEGERAKNLSLTF